MKLKIALATSSALALLMAATGIAYAGNNKATVDQTGNDNDAAITQSGSGNSVGVPGSTAVYAHVKQSGNDNNIDISQDGNNNNVAHFQGGLGEWPAGNVLQYGDMNDIHIQETDTSNFVWGIRQEAHHGSVITNKLSIVQDTNGAGGYSQQVVGYIEQTNTKSNVTDLADQNNIDIEQHGSGYGSGNALRSASQNGRGNTIVVDENGTKNLILGVTQSGNYNAATANLDGDQNVLSALEQDGNDNTANVSLAGNQNGSGVDGYYTPYGASPGSIYATGSRISLDLFASPASDVVGVTQTEVHQTGGNGNMLAYNVVGNYNLYGFTQTGSNNDINGVVTGDGNQAAIYQDGDGNITDFIQEGGGSNNLGISMVGNSTHINAQQLGAGSNMISVSITGNNNNNYPTSAAIAGDALGAKLVADGELGSALTQGTLIQNGSGNELALMVDTSLNVFATYQHGNGNSITGTINTGNANQIVVAQIGDGNTAAFTQSGMGNNIGITQ